MKFMVKARREGKTTNALRWVARGHQVRGYPGWSRVLVVPTINIEVMLRQEPCPDRPGESWWHVIEDWSHRVYALKDFATAHRVNPFTQVAIDEWELCLRQDIEATLAIMRTTKVTHATMSVDRWDDEPPLGRAS